MSADTAKLIAWGRDAYSFGPDDIAKARALAAALEAAEAQRDTLAEALKGLSNAYGCFAGCTGALPGAPFDGHRVACRAARAALAAVEPPEEEA